MDVILFAIMMFFGLGLLALRAIYSNAIIGIAGAFYIVTGAYVLDGGITTIKVVNNTVTFIQESNHSQIWGLMLILLGIMLLITMGVGGEHNV